MKTLMLIAVLLFSTVASANEAVTLNTDFYTNAETIWHDVDAEPMLYHVPGIHAIELNDGHGLYLMSDGFYYHHVIGGRRVSRHDYINKEFAIEEMWTVAQNYNYFIRRYGNE